MIELTTMDETFAIKNLEFPHEFFEDEVREDFYVPNMMKRFWAAQLKVLQSFSEVCAKYDIPWYAGEGTLLGAVRHKGYIPWDDDIDVYMMRDDFPRFLEVVEQELPGHHALTIYRDTAILPCTIRLVNGMAIRDTLEYLQQYYGCPFVVGLDIFALDNVFDDPEQESVRMKKVRDIRDAVELIDDGKEKSPDFKKLLKKIELTNGVHPEKGKNLKHELIKIKEDLYASCKSSDTERLAIFWELWSPRYLQREWFANRVKLPFEGAQISASAEYETLLKNQYGDYKKRVRGGGGHVYPCYVKQLDTIEEQTKKHLYCYTYREEDLLKERETPTRTYALRVAEMLAGLYTQMEAQTEAGNREAVQPLQDSIGKLETTLAKLTENTGGRDLFDERREVVFLASRASWWGTMERAYRRYRRERDVRVTVLSVPWYEKEIDGSTHTPHDEKSLFPEGVQVLSADEYDIAARCPDVIVMQVPFDGWNRTITTAPFFFSDNLRRYTNRLVYIPCYDVPTPEADDEKAIISLQSLIEQPAVMFADEVWLRDEGARVLYIEWLCKIGGEGVRAVCEKKFITEDKADV